MEAKATINTLGKTIKMLRHEKNWNQQETARQLAISIPAFSKIETGVTDVNYSRLAQIAALFGLSPVGLLELNGSAERGQSPTALEAATQRLQERDLEILALQKKLIELLEQLKTGEPLVKNVGSVSK